LIGDPDDGGGGGFQLDDRTAFSIPSSFILIPEVVSKTAGVDPATFPAKWLGGSGSNVDVLVSSNGSYDTYRTDSSGDTELYNFRSDGSYHLTYLYDITTGVLHSTSSSTEVGTWTLDSAGRTLTLTPTANRATTCAGNANNCENTQEANVPRTFSMFTVVLKPFTISGNDTGQRNGGILMAGPCAPFMFDLDSFMCETGKTIEAVIQRVD
jgi:hypothetical protein